MHVRVMAYKCVGGSTFLGGCGDGPIMATVALKRVVIAAGDDQARGAVLPRCLLPSTVVVLHCAVFTIVEECPTG
jgi:hypothetical protein